MLITTVDAARVHAATGGQAGLWFAAQRLGLSCAYNVVIAFTIEGDLDPGRLESAWRLLVDSTATLRLRTGLDGHGRVVQWFAELPAGVAWLDSAVSPTDGIGVDPALLPFVREPFDLDGGELCRMVAARTRDGRTTALLILHHLLVDGTSQPALADRFASCLLDGSVAPATAERYVQLVDLVRRAEAACLARERDRWTSRLVDRLAGGAAWPAATSAAEPGHLRHHLDRASVDRLRATAERAGGSLFLGLIGAVHRSLSMLGWERTVTSVSATVRPRGGGYDDVVGTFINQVPLVATHRPRESLADLLGREVPGWRSDLAARALSQVAMAEDPRLGRVAPELNRVIVSERRSSGALTYRRDGAGPVRSVSAELFVRSYAPKADMALRFIRRPDGTEYDLDWSAAVPATVPECFPDVLRDVLGATSE